MANPKIQAILGIDNKQFITEIQRSRKSLESFEKVGKTVTSALKTIAVTVGAATTAQEVFNRVIKGSQTTSDAYDRVMRACTTSVDNFFTALSTFDFTAFNKGLEAMILKARDAQLAIDQLGNTTMSYNYFNAKNQAEFAELIAVARDTTQTDEARKAATEKALKVIEDQKEIATTFRNRSIDAIKKIIAEGNGLSPDDFDFITIEDIFRIDAMAESDQIKEDLTATYGEYRKQLELINKKFSTKITQVVGKDGNIEYRKSVGDVEGYNAALTKLNRTYADAVLFDTLLVKINDAKLQNLMNMGMAAYNAERNVASMQRTMARLGGTINKLGGGGKVEVEVEAPENSLAALEKQISDLQVKYKLAVDQQSRIQIQKEIEALTNKKHIIQMEYKMLAPMKEQKQVFSVQMPDFKDFKIKNPIKADDIKLNNEYVESLNAIASVMSSISTMTTEGAAAWIKWSADVMTAIALVIPQIKTLVVAKTAEGAASAGAEAAKTPLVGWLMVGGAIAAALAAFAAIPAFSKGGVFNSPYTTGDKNLARLNGGEMILNRGQQANLFNLLDRGAPYGGGQVTFKIHGKELVGVLNNHNNKISKVL